MKAMLFAAGKGTRLQPLTNNTPKCLVTAGNTTLLEHNINFLKAAGVDSIVVNVHHLGQQIIDFISKKDFGIELAISEELELLETGGGLLKAKQYFQDEKAFVVCNSDIYTDMDLKGMVRAHRERQNLATLAVSGRETARYLRFNDQSLLCGWENKKTGEVVSWGEEIYKTRAFNGVQVLSPQVFDFMDNQDLAFSTIPVYLKAAQAGARIAAFEMDQSYWIDIGTLEKLETLRNYLKGTTGEDSNPRLA